MRWSTHSFPQFPNQALFAVFADDAIDVTCMKQERGVRKAEGEKEPESRSPAVSSIDLTMADAPVSRCPPPSHHPHRGRKLLEAPQLRSAQP